MSLIILSLLFAGSVTAQLTTSFAFLKTNLGTDKVGYLGSVVGVSNDHTTLAVVYDNGTDPEFVGTNVPPETLTVGPTMFEVQVSLPRAARSNITDAFVYNLRCEMATASPDADSTCTVSYGPGYWSIVACNTRARTTGTSLSSVLHTYSGRGTYSAGVETIVHTFVFGPYTRGPIPEWCDASSLPSTGDVTTLTRKPEEIGTYQVVITAGAEKLSATQASPATLSSATPTAAAQSTGAAMPMKTIGPALVGLGAALAAFVV